MQDFLNNFGNLDGSIDWEKLLRFNSSKEKVPWIAASKVVAAVSAESNVDDSDDADDFDMDEDEEETLDD